MLRLYIKGSVAILNGLYLQVSENLRNLLFDFGVKYQWAREVRYTVIIIFRCCTLRE